MIGEPARFSRLRPVALDFPLYARQILRPISDTNTGPIYRRETSGDFVVSAQ